MKKRQVFLGGLTVTGLAAGAIYFVRAWRTGRTVAATANNVSAGQEEVPDLTLAIGPRRLAEQFSALLPQVHLTLVSVLQGLALAILVEGLIDIIDVEGLAALTHPDLTLRYLASLFTVALIWHLYANAFVMFIWPYRGMHTFLQFVLASIEIFTFSSVESPGFWLFGMSGVALVGGVIRQRNTRLVSAQNYEKEEYYLRDMHVEKRAARDMFAIGGLLVAGVVARLLWESQGAPALSLQIFDTIVGGAIAVQAFLMIVFADRSAKQLLELMLQGSAWEYSGGQIVERKRHPIEIWANGSDRPVSQDN